MNTTRCPIGSARQGKQRCLPAAIVALLLLVRPSLGQDPPPPEPMGDAALEPATDPAVAQQFSPGDPTLWSSAGAWDHRYVTAQETCLPRYPTCTSCADSPCRCCGGPVKRWWNLKAKPCLQETYWGYCEYFDEPPYGASTRYALGAQVANGFRGQLVLYQYDFHPTCSSLADQLNPYGRERLDRLACRLASFPAPLVIEGTPEQPGLDEQRKAHVLAELNYRGFAVSADCVVIQRRRDGMAGVRDGLQADDATIIYENLLDQTLRRGQILGTSDQGLGGGMPMLGGEGSQ